MLNFKFQANFNINFKFQSKFQIFRVILQFKLNFIFQVNFAAPVLNFEVQTLNFTVKFGYFSYIIMFIVIAIGKLY